MLSWRDPVGEGGCPPQEAGYYTLFPSLSWEYIVIRHIKPEGYQACDMMKDGSPYCGNFFRFGGEIEYLLVVILLIMYVIFGFIMTFSGIFGW